MAEPSKAAIVDTLLERYGRLTLAEQADIKLRDQPNTLFQVFQLAVLLDGRVHPDTAVRAFLEFRDRGWTTNQHMLEAPSAEVVNVLTGLAYPDEDAVRIATALHDAALHLQEDHGGNIGGLRIAAEEDPQREREELERFARVRDVTVDAFFREIQILWDELMPFADKKPLDAAGRLHLGDDAQSLRALTDSDEDFVRLADALVRIRHEDDGYEPVLQAAAR